MTGRRTIGASAAAFIAVACCAGLPAVAAVGAWLIAPVAGVVVLALAVGAVIVHRRRCRRDAIREAQPR
jgi:Flp pilus assembly protein TadB